MLATKSVRMASTRRRSLTSSIVATAEPSGSGPAVDDDRHLRRPVELEHLPRAVPGERPPQRGLDGVVDEQPGVRAGHRPRPDVAVAQLAVATHHDDAERDAVDDRRPRRTAAFVGDRGRVAVACGTRRFDLPAAISGALALVDPAGDLPGRHRDDRRDDDGDEGVRHSRSLAACRSA